MQPQSSKPSILAQADETLVSPACFTLQRISTGYVI